LNCTWTEDEKHEGIVQGDDVGRAVSPNPDTAAKKSACDRFHGIKDHAMKDVDELTNAFSATLSIAEGCGKRKPDIISPGSLKSANAEGDQTIIDAAQPTSQTRNFSKSSQPQANPRSSGEAIFGSFSPHDPIKKRQPTPWPDSPSRSQNNPFRSLEFGSIRNTPEIQGPSPTTSSQALPSIFSPSSSSTQSRPASRRPGSGNKSAGFDLFVSGPQKRSSGTHKALKGNGGGDEGDDNEDNDDDDENGGDDNRKRAVKRPKSEPRQKPMLCPYFKRTGGKATHESCKHDFSSVHRIK
jgi:hypothetical protein